MVFLMNLSWIKLNLDQYQIQSESINNIQAISIQMLVTKISSNILKFVAVHNITHVFCTLTTPTQLPCSETIDSPSVSSSAQGQGSVPSLSSLFLSTGKLDTSLSNQSLTAFYQQLARKQSNLLNPYAKMSPISKSYSKLVLKVRSLLHIDEALQLIQDNFDEFNRIGRSLILDYLNQMHMPNRSTNSLSYIKLNTVLGKFKDLNLYQLTMRLSIMEKTKIYYSFRRQMKQYSQLLNSLAQQILLKLQNQQQVSIYDCYNILAIFRIQIHEQLFDKTLSIIDRLIVSLVNKDTHYDKLHQILFHQLSFAEWSTIRKYPNIVRFFVDKFTVKTSKQIRFIDNTCEMFRKIVDFRFHLVGQRRIPVCIKEIIQILQPQIQNISVKNLCTLIQSCGLLPARFFPDFKKALIRQLMKLPNSFEESSKSFPFKELSNDEIKYFLQQTKDAQRIVLWNIIYKSTLEEQQAFLRLPIAQILVQSINKKLIFMQTETKQLEPGQAASRYCILIHHFDKNNNKEVLQKLKSILTYYFQRYGLQNIVQNFTVTNYLNLFTLFSNEKQVISVVKKQFKNMLQRRQTKSSIYNKKHEYNCLNAIKFHIQSKNQLVQQAVDILIQEVYAKNSSSKHIDPKYEIPLLFQIISVEESDQLKKAKQNLWNKITDKDIPMLCEYYSLYPKKNLRSFQQIFIKMTKFKVPFQDILVFTSSLSSELLQNNRGRLEYHVVEYLKNYKKSLKLGLKYLNEINRFISMLSRHVIINQFLNRLFIQNLLQIQRELITPLQKNSLAHNPRLILNYLQKFQQIMWQKDLSSPKSHQILNKIFKLMSKLQTLHPTPYVELKLMQFTFVYRQHLKVSQTIEDIQLQSSYNIEKLIQKGKNLEQMGEILFGVLKLRCFDLESFQNINIVQIVTVLRQTINSNRLNYYQLSQSTKILNYQMRILRTDIRLNEKIRQLILPLLILSQQRTGFLLKFKAYEPLIELATRTHGIKSLKPLIMKILTPGKLKINPSTIQYLMDCLPLNIIDRELFGLMMQKIIVMINLFDANISRVLYFVERMFYQWPKQLESERQKIWSAANKILSAKIEDLQLRNHNSEQIYYSLGRYPLYMYACIKAGRVHGNKIFKYLAQTTLSNPQYFMNRIKNNEVLKFINDSIFLYLMNCPQYSSFKVKNQRFSIKYSPFHLLSNELQDYLRENKIQFKKMYMLNKIMTVPYYIKDEDEIIFVYRKNQLFSNFIYEGQNKEAMSVQINKNQIFKEEEQSRGRETKKIPMFKPKQSLLKKNQQLLESKKIVIEKPQLDQKQNFISGVYLQMNGNVRYIANLCKQIFPNKKIRYWDSYKQKIIDLN